MNDETELNHRIREIWAGSVRFHGQGCALLALGVRVCDTALTHLGIFDPDPERLVCVSEYDGCCIDAIQIGLHCTAGKKHLLYHKTGRLIFTVYDLESGKSVRICTHRAMEETVQHRNIGEILSMTEAQLFYFEKAHPLTNRTLEKVNQTCNTPADSIPDRDGGIQDSPDQFRKYDLIDDGIGRTVRRRL